jgi:predicted Zn finger-like uncharacterized protein
MKITCQSCQSKYNVADEKVQGKIVKIRCRKCGATIVVQGTGGLAANGSAAATGGAGADPVAEAPQWHVNLAEGEPRTMTLGELADACNAGVIPLDTFIWTDGMDDWKAVSDVEAVMAAISGGVNAGTSAETAGLEGSAPQPAFQPPKPESPLAGAYEPPQGLVAAASFQAPAELPPEPRRAAVAKREARGRDLFGSMTGEEVQTSAPVVPQRMGNPVDDGASRATGERNENSVLFSLAVLTKDAGDRQSEEEAPKSTGRTTEDSGLIDLKALAAKAESMRPSSAFADAGAFAPPLGFAPPPVGMLGSPLGEAPPKSKLPLLIGGGAGVALLLVLGIVIGVKLGASGSAAAAPSAAAAMPTATTTAEPSATATAEASVAAPAPSASVAAKPKSFSGGGTYHAPVGGPAAKPAGGGAATAGGATAGGATPPPTPPPPKKAGSDCGCNGDLMCLMKCSTH